MDLGDLAVSVVLVKTNYYTTEHFIILYSIYSIFYSIGTRNPNRKISFIML